MHVTSLDNSSLLLFMNLSLSKCDKDSIDLRHLQIAHIGTSFHSRSTPPHSYISGISMFVQRVKLALKSRRNSCRRRLTGCSRGHSD